MAKATEVLEQPGGRPMDAELPLELACALSQAISLKRVADVAEAWARGAFNYVPRVILTTDHAPEATSNLGEYVAGHEGPR